VLAIVLAQLILFPSKVKIGYLAYTNVGGQHMYGQNETLYIAYIIEVHKIYLAYGPTIRIAPNELAFIDPEAWKDIYGYRVGSEENVKDQSQVFSDEPNHPSIFSAPRADHARIRRLLSHGFSDKALKEEESVLSGYTRLLIERLHQVCERPVDLVEWYNASR
jgi:hypothetical protein